MPHKNHRLALLFCAFVPLASPLQAQAAPACEGAYASDMASARSRLAYARRWMENTFSNTWDSYGFNCNYDMDARQTCTTASEYLSMAARSGLQVVVNASASGCYACNNDALWQLAHELDEFATALAQQNFASNGSMMLEQMMKNHVNGVSACQPGQSSQSSQPDPATTAAPPILPNPPGACSSVNAYPDARLNSGFGWVLDNTSLPECVSTCAAEPTCTGYDYNDASATCVIRSETQGQAGLEGYGGWTHYECAN